MAHEMQTQIQYITEKMWTIVNIVQQQQHQQQPSRVFSIALAYSNCTRRETVWRQLVCNMQCNAMCQISLCHPIDAEYSRNPHLKNSLNQITFKHTHKTQELHTDARLSENEFRICTFRLSLNCNRNCNCNWNFRI